MGLFDNMKFPAWTMQQLNLDWILNKIKALAGFLPDDGVAGQVLTRTDDGAKWDDVSSAISSSVNCLTQIESDCAHNLVTDREIGVLSDDGYTVGGSINISDVMIKPRNCAAGAIAVFDGRGNLIPMSFDSSTPLVTLQSIAIFKNLFLEDETHDRRIIQFFQDFMVETGVLEFETTNMTAAGNIYRQNITVNQAFPLAFDTDAKPTIIWGSSNNMNSTCWLGGVTCDNEKILRICVYSHQNANISVKIPYMVIGKKGVRI